MSHIDTVKSYKGSKQSNISLCDLQTSKVALVREDLFNTIQGNKEFLHCFVIWLLLCGKSCTIHTIIDIPLKVCVCVCVCACMCACMRARMPKEEKVKTNTTGRAFLVSLVHSQYGLTILKIFVSGKQPVSSDTLKAFDQCILVWQSAKPNQALGICRALLRLHHNYKVVVSDIYTPL